MNTELNFNLLFKQTVDDIFTIFTTLSLNYYNAQICIYLI